MRRLKLVSTLVVLVTGALLVVAQSQTPQLPAPLVDRIGFPEGYQDLYQLLQVFDRPDTAQIRVIYGNDIAASFQPGDPSYAYGSILVFEQWSSKRDAQNNILFDDEGHFVRDQLTTVFVMRKERGFGTAYKEFRNGEWEYVSYRPDRTYQSAPSNTNGCASCHMQAKTTDFVFRVNQIASKASGTQPDNVMFNYKFVPNNMRVKVGSVVTFYNGDEFDHNVANLDRSFNSGLMHSGGSFRLKATQPGTINYQCTIHPNMRGTITVDP
ncbi:MAG: cytochrome P460 family protein [Acidobacteria bacterium]|nr:cytochrome P460 family protein [Acidobacteriota bacterium]